MQKALSLIQEANWSARVGLAIIALYVVVALFAPFLAPYGEAQVVGGQYEPWSAQFLLGTDNIGRDMLSRIIYGARNTIGIALVATALSFVLGCGLGFIAAVFGGVIDVAISRINDVLLSIPLLIFALMLLTAFGSSMFVLINVIAVLEATRVFRVARALAMDIVVLDFFEQAKLRGEGLPWLLLKELLPCAVSPLAAEFGLRFCFVFLFLSSMSFIGLGLQPPTADWGSMVKENATLIGFGDWTPLLPAAAIAILAIAVNLVVDCFLETSPNEGQ